MKKIVFNNRKKVLALFLSAFLCLSLAACSGTPAETAAPETTEAQTTAAEETTTQKQAEETTTVAESKTIGEKTAATASFLLTNKTGQDITSFVLLSGQDTAVQEEQWQEEGQDTETVSDDRNLLEKDDVFKDGETRMAFLEMSTQEAADEGQEEAAESDKVLSEEYAIAITLKDGTSFTLHSFPTDITKGEICMEGEIGYLVYKHANSAESVSTLMAEKTIAGDLEVAQPGAVQNDEEEEQEAQEPVTDNPVYEDPVYVDPGAGEGGNEDPVYVDPGAGEGGNEDPVYEDPGAGEGGNEDPGAGEGGNEDPGAGEGGDENPGNGDDDGCVDDPLFY